MSTTKQLSSELPAFVSVPMLRYDPNVTFVKISINDMPEKVTFYDKNNASDLFALLCAVTEFDIWSESWQVLVDLLM